MKYFIIFLLALSFFSCQNGINEPSPTYQMSQNYPNPFTDTTVILYGIPSTGHGTMGPWIRLVVNDRFNQTVATLVNIHNHPYGHDLRVVWDGRGPNYEKVPAGIYYIELQQLDASNSDEPYVHVRRVALKQ